MLQTRFFLLQETIDVHLELESDCCLNLVAATSKIGFLWPQLKTYGMKFGRDEVSQERRVASHFQIIFLHMHILSLQLP